MMNKTPLPPNEPDGPTPEQLAAELAAACHLSALDHLKLWSVVLDSVRSVVVWGFATDDGEQFIGIVGKAVFWRN